MTRIISSPQRDILPLRSISPDWYLEHVSPNTAPTALDLRKLDARLRLQHAFTPAGDASLKTAQVNQNAG
jgi:hypothetical protein